MNYVVTEVLTRRPAASPAAGRLLLVLAHPDDESFFCAGTVARHVASGGEAALVCATRGERGSQPVPPVCEPGELGRVRSAELRAACQIMGVSRLTFLGYGDGGLAAAERDEAVARISRVMAGYHPEAVVTFGPEGIYRHPDHVAVHHLTVVAFDRVFGAWPSGGMRRLWYVAVPSAFWRYRRDDWVAAGRDKARPRAGRLPVPDGGPEAAIDIRETLPVKAAALLAHRSQRHNVDRAFGSMWDFRAQAPRDREAMAALGREYFTLGRGPRPAYLLEDSLLDSAS